MLTYSFDNIGKDSLYNYLYCCIKNDIIAGVLSPEERLPSKRNFAKNLGVSTITVENAYAQLMAEGYVNSIPKKGYYIAHLESKLPQVSSFLPPMIEQESPQKKYALDFVSNQTDPSRFPFSIWAKLMREVLSQNRGALMQVSPGMGILPLRQAIAVYLRQFRGMEVSPAQIIVGAGTEYLYGLLVHLLGQEHLFAVEDPGYQKVSMVYESCGAKCVPIAMDSKGIRIDLLEASNANVAHISPSHHYPTGIVTPTSRRFALLDWANQASQRYLIEDDYDSEFRLNGKPIPALYSLDHSGHTIYVNTFSKTLTPTIRVSYLVLPPKLIEEFHEKLGFYACTVSNFEQYTLARFLDEGYFEKHINRMRKYYRNLRNELLCKLQNSPLCKKTKIAEEEAGLHFLMKVRYAGDDQELIQEAAKNGIRITCLSEYYAGVPEKRSEHTLIMNYSALSTDRISDAVAALNQIL